MSLLGWLADLVALIHLGLIAFVVGGGFVAARRPRLRLVHLAVVGIVLGLSLLGQDCPLTLWEQALRRGAGEVAYTGGFIEHYLIRPLTGGGITPLIDASIQATAIVPNVIAYATLAARRRPTQCEAVADTPAVSGTTVTP